MSCVLHFQRFIWRLGSIGGICTEEKGICGIVQGILHSSTRGSRVLLHRCQALGGAAISLLFSTLGSWWRCESGILPPHSPRSAVASHLLFCVPSAFAEASCCTFCLWSSVVLANMGCSACGLVVGLEPSVQCPPNQVIFVYDLRVARHSVYVCRIGFHHVGSKRGAGT